MSKPRILYINRNEYSFDFLTGNLRKSGYEVISVEDVKSALKLAFRYMPDLILADICLSDMDWEYTCRQLRNTPDTARVPIVILSGSRKLSDVLYCFDMGADDYVSHPFSVQELVARINALLRRANYRTKRSGRIKVGPITIDSNTYVADCNGEMLSLTHTEFEILRALMGNQGTILSRDFLLDRIRGYEFDGQTRTVDMHIRNLRSKLKGNARIIKTVRGEGYVCLKHVS